MKLKNLSRVLPLIFGWYFVWSAPYGEDGVRMTTVVGSFKSEALCKESFEDTKSMLEQLGATASMKKCFYKQEA